MNFYKTLKKVVLVNWKDKNKSFLFVVMLELFLKSINPFLLVLLLILSWLSFTFNNWCSLRLTSSAYISFPPQRLYFMKKMFYLIFFLLFAVGLKELTFTISTMFIFPVHFFFWPSFFFPFFCFSLLSMPFQKKKLKSPLKVQQMMTTRKKSIVHFPPRHLWVASLFEPSLCEFLTRVRCKVQSSNDVSIITLICLRVTLNRKTNLHHRDKARDVSNDELDTGSVVPPTKATSPFGGTPVGRGFWSFVKLRDAQRYSEQF